MSPTKKLGQRGPFAEASIAEKPDAMNNPCLSDIREYQKFSRYYDSVLNPFLDHLRQEISRLAAEPASGRILDICCGTGRQLKLLEGRGASLAGVDLSPDMLAVARRNTLPQTALVLADGSRLPFGDKAFETVVITLALHEKTADCRDELLAEARRVVVPGGTFLVADYQSGPGARSWMGLRAVSLVERVAGLQHYLNFRDFLARGALAALLTRHGLGPQLQGRFLLGSAGLYLARNG